MKHVLKSPYVADIGNGFTKRSADGKLVLTEPSIVATYEDNFQFDGTFDVINLNNQRDVYIGEDVWGSGLKPKRALSDGQLDRYKSREFAELLYGFIAKDMSSIEADDIEMPLLVLGLPNLDFERYKDFLKEEFKGKHIVEINKKQLIITIKKVEVIPQPIGTILYLLKNKLIKGNTSLIVDGGYGTIDITHLNGKKVVDSDGADEGMIKAYTLIERYIRKNYNINNLVPHKVPLILEAGLDIAGENYKVFQDKEVQRILDNHFEDVYQFLSERYNFREYDQIVFTGGMSLAHKARLQEKKHKNFIVLDQGQVANCIGYYEYGKVVW